MSIESVVNKSGETWLLFSTFPTKDGLTVHVKTHPSVEEFMSAMSNGRTAGANEFGDKRWYSSDPERALMAYNFTKALPPSARYDLQAVGKSLATNYTGESFADWPVNLAFLRLEGTSRPDGITFGVKDVFSVPFRRQLRVAVSQAFRQFVQDHLRQVKITLLMTGSET